ncbi:MAG: glycosyltransferase, partial [Ignavibacteriaceae bacterium]|nr:glycosyltransferase [Ignavibacteriaceae bacterium]
MKNNYVLITAAKNEADFIESTIKSVVCQTLQPKKWIIVSDHSTDGTDDLVNKYSNEYSFIRLLKFDGAKNRNFASKVHAISAAYDLLKNLDFDFIGILDADITFDENYYKNITKKFDESARLGIAGGGFYDVYDGKKVKISYSQYSVRGAVQLFRRKCFEEIGGIYPLRWGGEDSVACANARMHGWEVKTFEDLVVLHNRKTSSVGLNIFKILFDDGKRDYNRGIILSIHFLRSITVIFNYPMIIGSLIQMLGYLSLLLKREKLIFSEELQNFIRSEQKFRLK